MEICMLRDLYDNSNITSNSKQLLERFNTYNEIEKANKISKIGVIYR